MPVHFYAQEIDPKLKSKRKLSAFLEALIRQHLNEVQKINLNYIFCTDAYLLEMNRQFLQHDTYTDVITFDLSETDQELQAEVYISVERLQENALQFKANYQQELHRVIFHGALHLCGFGDKKPADKKLMTEKEDECLNAYQF